MQNRFLRSTQLIANLLQKSMQPSKHFSKHPARFKSSSSIDLTFPTTNIASKLSEAFQLSFASNTPSSLQKHVQDGLNYFKNFDTKNAMSSLNKAIAFLDKKDESTLSVSEKMLLSQAFTCKARIVQIGTDEDEKIAIRLLDKALELTSTFEEAQTLKQDIRADSGLPSPKR